MFHSSKKLWLAFFLLVAGHRSAFGFSVLGPLSGAGSEAFQKAPIGYALPGDIASPRNLGDEYRWNVPTVYYTCDATFLRYFGSNGLAAVDSAFAVLNSLTNVSSYSQSLSEWPLTTSRYNETALALSLLDVKSTTLGAMMEQLALGAPDRWVWCLHDRYTAGLTCPNFDYLVIQRNYDPASQIYSPYVNGTLYDYEIFETCLLSPNPFPFDADTLPYATDPTTSFSAVASQAFQLGQYYTGLTRDDVGGLRYLLAATNKFVESAGFNSLQLYTNKSAYTNIISTNLALFTAQALTNNQAALQALYPNLAILSVTNVFTNLITTNITAYFTNNSLNPAGTLTLVLATNFTTNVANYYNYTFGNVLTNHHYTKGFVTTQKTNITFGTSPFSPAGGGTLTTNVTSTTVLATNYINGDYFILPTNLFNFQIVSTQLVSVVSVTNVVVIATNAPGVTNINGVSFTMNIITYFTNYSYNIYPIQYVSNSVALRQGIEKIRYIRRDFDSLLGTYWAPITNTYNLTAVTNAAPFTQTFLRVVTQPDVLFTAQDLEPGPAAVPAIFNFARTTNNFNTSQIPTNQPGPGTIEPQITITFNKVGPLYINNGPFFVVGGPAYSGDANSTLSFIWGSFDGTTNAPIIYPDTTSLASLESQVFFQVLNQLLPPGSISGNNAGNPYSIQLQAQGASPPFTWANPSGLPAGLSVSTDGILTGSLAGAVVGTYDFTVQATDSVGRTAQSQFFIEIDP